VTTLRCRFTALFLAASLGTSCTSTPGADGGTDAGGDGCTLIANTSASATTSPDGCAVLVRDASACEAARTSAGLSGFWLKMSCRVALSVSGQSVRAVSDGQPDHRSNYFQTTDACYEAYTGGTQNPNLIAIKSYTVDFPMTPDTNARSMQGTAVVGLAINGVPVFGNFAAPGDDIFAEALTFDRCSGHPQMNGSYHHHSEPTSITYDDSNFVGVMRDGYPIYGRKDADGSYPTLDTYGGHTATTADSPSTAVYHYHVNEQTSSNPGTLGHKHWFLTTGNARGSFGNCTGCN
jgi:hypothetical protein